PGPARRDPHRVGANGLPVPEVAHLSVRVVDAVLLAFRGVRADPEVTGGRAAAVGHVGEVRGELVLVVDVLVSTVERGLKDLPALLRLLKREALEAGVGIVPLEQEVDLPAVVDGLARDVDVPVPLVNAIDVSNEAR